MSCSSSYCEEWTPDQLQDLRPQAPRPRPQAPLPAPAGGGGRGSVSSHPALPTCNDLIERNFSKRQWYGCPVVKNKMLQGHEPRAADCDLVALGRSFLGSLTPSRQLILTSSEATRNGRGCMLSLDLDLQPHLENGYSAWHATRAPNLPKILAEGLLPGPSDPYGIYTYKDGLKHKCFGKDYCPAVRVYPGVFVKIVLHVSAAGLWAGQGPKVIRKDQWISDKAVVLGMQAEVFHADAFASDEVVLDLNHMLGLLEEA